MTLRNLYFLIYFARIATANTCYLTIRFGFYADSRAQIFLRA